MRDHFKMTKDKVMEPLLGMVGESMKDHSRTTKLMGRENFLIQKVTLVVFTHFRMEGFLCELIFYK